MNSKKKNTLVAVALATTLASGLPINAYAEELQADTYQTEETKETDKTLETNEAEETSNQEETDQNKEATQEEKIEENTVSTQSNTTPESDEGGVQTQADDDGIVIDKNNKIITYNNPVDVTITQKDVSTNSGNERVTAIGKFPDGSGISGSSSVGWKFIYNAPVTINFDSITARAAWILPSSAEGGFQNYTFNDAVTVNVINSNIQQLAAYANYFSVSSLWGNEKELTLNMKKKLTYNIKKSTVTTFIGGFSKSGSFTGDSWPPVKIDSNCALDGGVAVNISEKSNVSTMIGGHYFTTGDTKESSNQVFTCKGIDVTADDSTIGGLVASYGVNGYTERTNDLKVDGDFNVTLKNGATLSTLISNGAVFGGNKQYISGNVTGKTTFTTATDMSMTQMRNVDVLNLGAPLAVKPASAGTGANFTLPTNGMQVNFVDESTWKNKDIAFAYQYTDGTYPAVDESQMNFNWTGDTLELKYSNEVDASTQQWQFNKTKAKVEYITNNEDTLTPDIVPTGTKVNEPTISKKGHQFEGWYTTEDFQDGTKFDFNQTIDDDIKLYAKWSVKDMTIKLEPNDGSKMNDVKVPYGSTMSEPILKIKEGHTLEGWYTTKDFQEGTKWDFSKAVEDDQTLYAKWVQNEQTVKVETNGGSKVDDIKVLYGKTIKEPTSSKEGYTLEGWYTDKDLTKKWNFKDAVKADMTLYAKWVQNEQTVKVETNGGSKVDDIKVLYGKTIKEPTSSKEGYTLEGWYTDKDLTTKWNFKDGVKADMTLYAKWVENKTPEKPEDPVKPSDDDKKPTDDNNKPSDDTNKGNETNDKENVEKPTVSTNTSSTNKTKKKSPKTGDTTPIVSSFAMMGAGLLSIIGILRKKENK